MRAALVMTVLVTALGMAQAHADDTYTCSKDEVVRTVAVTTQTQTGRGCEVRYQKVATGKAETLWHAGSGTQFCTDRAKSFVENLGKSGWACAEADTIASNATPMPQPFAAAVEVARPPEETATNDDMTPAPVGVTAATQPMAMQGKASAVPATVRQPIDPKHTAVDGRLPIDPGIHLRPSIH